GQHLADAGIVVDDENARSGFGLHGARYDRPPWRRHFSIETIPPPLKYRSNPGVIERWPGPTRELMLMLTLIALSAALLQEPPAPSTPEVRTRIMVMGPQGSLDKDGDGQVTRE